MTAKFNTKHTHALVLLIALALGSAPTLAQETMSQTMDHSTMQMPAPEPAPAVEETETKKPGTKPVTDPHAGHAVPAPAAEPTAAQPVDHAAMGHDMPMPQQEPAEPVDHSATGHDMPPNTEEMDHSSMDHGMQMSNRADAGLPATAPPINPIPPVTPADRIAAFPDVDGHSVHGNGIHSFWLLDRLEAWDADPGTGIGWEATSWIGTDLDRIWLRSEGEHVDGSTESADVEVLYGRAIARWWGLVAGMRHDFGEGPSQTFAAIGVQGLSPYKFEVEATAYVGQSGQTAARLEVEYETLFTNRLILQWQAEAELYGKDDERRGIGSGLSTIKAGLRLRYEFTRRFAPYIGIVHGRVYGGTADFRRVDEENIDDTRFVAGLRLWF